MGLFRTAVIVGRYYNTQILFHKIIDDIYILRIYENNRPEFRLNGMRI